jgi:hypothetical protein
LFTSVTKTKKQQRPFGKTVVVYLILTVVAVVVNYVYGLFGHGVHSAAMTWMFLYPLMGGALIYFLLERFFPDVKTLKAFRLGYNSYNSGIATLTLGSFLKGILEIAGTDSGYLIVFTAVGGLALGMGLLIFGILAITGQRNREMKKRINSKGGSEKSEAAEREALQRS